MATRRSSIDRRIGFDRSIDWTDRQGRLVHKAIPSGKRAIWAAAGAAGRRAASIADSLLPPPPAIASRRRPKLLRI